MHKTNATTKPARRSPRLSADERRDAIVAAGMDEFAAHGLAGASVDAIAKRAGVSQPYVYQLFGTKKDLFLAVVRRGFERTRLAFEEALRRQRAGEFPACDLPLGAMGIAYMELLDDRTLLLVQLQAYAACSDPDVQAAVREEFGALHRFVAAATGASPEEIHQFFAEGMLLNVGAAVQLPGEPVRWSLELLGGAG
ncbi:MAG: TetR/AcrR family transcriptional regulator [Chloroflexota bacterium]|nr:TetR/AcrR family transcriptional regulator [Chloroflexota bacterium]